MNTKKRTRQVSYSSWYDKLKSGHENYWKDISSIAQLLAFSLEAGYRDYNGKSRPLSSITVEQYKEKFGTPRVYCTFGNSFLVNSEYKYECKIIDEKNIAYEEWLSSKDDDSLNKKKYMPWTISVYESGKYPLPKPSLTEFTKKCIVRDAQWYRTTYLDIIGLFPKYEKVIRSGASYSELLFESVEKVNEYYDSELEKAKNSALDQKLIDQSIEFCRRNREFALSVFTQI